MALDVTKLDAIRRLLHKSLVGTVVLVVAFSGAAGYLVNGYIELARKKDEHAALVRDFGDQRAAYEKQRADEQIALSSRKLELDQREFILSQKEAAYKDGLHAVQQQAAEVEAARYDLKRAAASVSSIQQAKQNEEKLQNIISEYFSFGVDLNAKPPCDAARRDKYEAAKAKYEQALGLAMTLGLYPKYRYLFNRHSVSWGLDRCAKE